MSESRDVRVLELWRFRYFNLLTRKWIGSRYRATKEDIAARYVKYELIGSPELHRVTVEPGQFSLLKSPAVDS